MDNFRDVNSSVILRVENVATARCYEELHVPRPSSCQSGHVHCAVAVQTFERLRWPELYLLQRLGIPHDAFRLPSWRPPRRLPVRWAKGLGADSRIASVVEVEAHVPACSGRCNLGLHPLQAPVMQTPDWASMDELMREAGYTTTGVSTTSSKNCTFVSPRFSATSALWLPVWIAQVVG